MRNTELEGGKASSVLDQSEADHGKVSSVLDQSEADHGKVSTVLGEGDLSAVQVQVASDGVVHGELLQGKAEPTFTILQFTI